MTCKDCIHFGVCRFSFDVEEPIDIYAFHYLGKNDLHNKADDACSNFKDKSRFVELPCKVGDQAYYIKHASVFDHTIDEIKYEFTATENGNIVRGIYFEPKHIGKTVFLTREEAEKKLGEMKL